MRGRGISEENPADAKRELKVTRLDRLSRPVLHLVTPGADLRARKIGLHVIEQGIDTPPARLPVQPSPG